MLTCELCAFWHIACKNNLQDQYHEQKEWSSPHRHIECVCICMCDSVYVACIGVCVCVCSRYAYMLTYVLALCMDLYVCKCMFMQYMQVHVLYYCHYIIVCVWCMQCIIMPLYNACYDSCGCILCMQKINNVHVCTCVCVWLSVCVCVHVHFAQISYSHCIQTQRVTIAAVSLSLILAAVMQQIQKKKGQNKCISFHLGMCAYMITSNEDN